MATTQFKRIVIEDFNDEERKLVSKLAYIINDAFDIITYSLNKGLSIKDNLKQDITTLTVTVDANGKPKIPSSLKYVLSSNCQGIIVIRAINSTNPSIFPEQTPFVNFTQNSPGILTIDNISGLQANQEYKLTLILIAG